MARDVRARCLVLIAALVVAIMPGASAAQGLTGASAKDVQSGNESIRKGQYPQAVERFEKAVAQNPNSIEALVGLSWAQTKMRLFQPAVQNAVKALDIDPENARAHALVGTILMRVGILPEAFASFNRSIGIDKGEPLALAGLAELNLYFGQMGESLKLARDAVAREPREPDFLYLLGQTAARQEKFDEAAQAYERFLTVVPDIDSDRRDRIKGLIQLYRRLSSRSLYAESGEKSVDLPIKFVNGRLPCIEVMINGKGPYRFVIDSGAGFVVISEDVAKALKMRPVASGGSSRGVSGTGRFPIVYGIIDRLGLGGLEIQNVPTYIRKVFEQPHNETIHGYLGLSVLNRFQVALDYRARVLELRPPDAEPMPINADDMEIPYRLTNGGMMSINVDIGKDLPLNFVVDTGASSTVVSTAAFTRYDLVEKQHKGVSVRVVGAGGVSENVPVVVLDRMSIAGTTRRQEFVRALVLDLGPINETAGFEQSGILGSDYLRFYRIEFDFPRHRLILRPYNGNSIASPTASTEEDIEGS